MDKLLNSPLFVKIIALVLAIMLYLTVNMDAPANQPTPSSIPRVSEETETLTDVHVKTYYDQQNYIVTMDTDSVSVFIKGPNSEIKKTKLQPSYELFIDLNGLTVGEHVVPIQYNGFSNKLSEIKVEPTDITVNVHKKINAEKNVMVEYINNDKIEEGYTAEQAIVYPNSVTVTGTKESIENIALVKVLIDLADVKQDLRREAPVKVYDQNGNELSVNVDPAVVDVKVPVSSPNKIVPIKVNRTGTLPDGISINEFRIEPNEVTVYGPMDTIKNIYLLNNIFIDLSTIKEDTVKEIELPKPNGVKKVVPEKIKVYIDIEDEKKKTFMNIPVNVYGLEDGYDLTFINPADGMVTVNIFGAPTVLENISSSNIELFLMVNEFSKGEHEVNIGVTAPPNIRWELSQDQATIMIK